MANMNKEELYQLAVDMMNDNNNTELTLLKTAETFEMLGDYKNSQELALKCLEKADDASKNSTYEIGIKKMQDNKISSYEEAIELFNKITDWKDASEQIVICKRKIEEIKENEKRERIEKEQQIKNAKKKRKRIAILISALILGLIIFVVLFILIVIPNIKYNAAVKMVSLLSPTIYSNIGGSTIYCSPAAVAGTAKILDISIPTNVSKVRAVVTSPMMCSLSDGWLSLTSINSTVTIN